MDPNGHLMGAVGAAILARSSSLRRDFYFEAKDMDFRVRDVSCGKCSNNCEIICVYRNNELIDAWGNRCDRGVVSA